MMMPSINRVGYIYPLYESFSLPFCESRKVDDALNWASAIARIETKTRSFRLNSLRRLSISTIWQFAFRAVRLNVRSPMFIFAVMTIRRYGISPFCLSTFWAAPIPHTLLKCSLKRFWISINPIRRYSTFIPKKQGAHGLLLSLSQLGRKSTCLLPGLLLI